MSDESDSKMEVQADACDSGGSVDTDHVMKRVPDDVWRVLLEYLAQADSMLLSRTCSWLNDAVARCITYLLLYRVPAAFSAARFTSLHRVATAADFDLTPMFSALRSSAQLRQLYLACYGGHTMEAIVDGIPFLSQLQTVFLRLPVVDGRLGRALASCKKLRNVKLIMRRGSDRSCGRIECVGDFLRELTAVPGLRCLGFVALRDEEDVKELRAAVGAWRELEELTVGSQPDRHGRRPLDVPLDGIAAAVASSCPRLRSLTLSGGKRTVAAVTAEDMMAIGSLTELQDLGLSGKLCADAIQHLSGATKLDKLRLTGLLMDDEAGKQMASVIQHSCQQLTSLSLDSFGTPATAISVVLRAVAAHSSLQAVNMVPYISLQTDAAKQELGVALADAVCRSSVLTWRFHTSFCVMSFLRTWNGRTPAAALTKLDLASSSEPAAEHEFAELLLRCVRSCPSLRRVDVLSIHGDVHAIVAAVRAEPLAPTRLNLATSPEHRAAYDDVSEELKAAGLVLLSIEQ
eukprot:PLAT4412.3.p1 GENE.PLAT4412.3~~PLAT4412.3.p1  ORF type:complete len:517 (-),score=97.12 PLAT4412.3:33-1583(-)